MLNIFRPKLSLIIPVRNQTATIESSLRIISALPIPKELIVVDDFSTDGTKEILKRLQPELKLKLIMHALHRGRGASVINGSAHAKGEFVMVIDTSSEPDFTYINSLLELAEGNKPDMLISAYSDPDNGLSGKFNRLLFRVLFGKRINSISSGYKICRLSKFQTMQFNPGVKAFNTSWLLKALLRGMTIKEIKLKSESVKNAGSGESGFAIMREILTSRLARK